MSDMVSGHKRVPKPKKGKEFSDFGKNLRVCRSNVLSKNLFSFGNPELQREG